MFFLKSNKKRRLEIQRKIFFQKKMELVRKIQEKKIAQETKSQDKKILENLHLFKVYQFDDKIRLGSKFDGGYVIGLINEEYDSYISAGISNEESFSRDFINKYNMTHENSFGFDGTIENYPYEYTENITFIKKNINSFNDKNNTNLFDLIDKYSRIFLKMDIEGGEYPWLLSLNDTQLNKFSQIVIEVHGITSHNGWGTNYEDKMKCIEKLVKTHYIIHAHGNCISPTRLSIPDVLELTFVNKKLFNNTPQLNTTELPIPNLDFSNTTAAQDYNLNFYPFVNKIV